MTILGRHTVAEARALGNAIDYEFKQVDGAFKSISTDWVAANPAKYDALSKNWAKAKSEWEHTWSRVQASLAVLKAAGGKSVSDDIMPAEDDYQNLLKHTSQGGRKGEDSLYMTKQHVQGITGKAVDLSKRPSQIDVPDVDMNNFKKVDGAIKQGEKAADNKLLYVGLGAGAAVAALVVVKVYL